MPFRPPFRPSSSPPTPGQEVAVLVADRHVEGVHAVVHALRDQLREHDGGRAVQRRVAEVVLPGAAGTACSARTPRWPGRRSRSCAMDATSDPCPVSVIANAPGTSRLMMSGSTARGAARCRGAARPQPNRPHCTPALICRLGSAMTSSSNAAMLPPWSSWPPMRLREGPVHRRRARRAARIWPSTRSAVLRHRLPLDALHFGPGGQLPRGEADVGPGAEQLAAEGLHVDVGRGARLDRGRRDGVDRRAGAVREWRARKR